MGDMKDKVKGFMKKVNSQLSSSSSGKFKGQGRVLGSSSSGSSYPFPSRSAQDFNSKSNSVSTSASSNPALQKPPLVNSDHNALDRSAAEPARPIPKQNPGNGFDPYDSLITNGNRTQHGYSLNVFDCPICGKPFGSEEEVFIHVDSCVNNSNAAEPGGGGDVIGKNYQPAESSSEMEVYVGTYLSGKPSDGMVEVVLKLFRNIAKEPENAKFRKIRLSNPKIKESVTDVTGGMELLEFVGFELREENGETWAVMEVPNEDGIGLITKVVTSLEKLKVQEPEKREETSVSTSEGDVKSEPKKVDRQVKVFFSVPENVAARIELPESFYNLSNEEVKREAELRRKKLADSQLLIPKSYKEKKAKAARKKYRRCMIRIQFPDGVVLQCVFAPWESTTALYEFVSSALKEPSLEFELMDPLLVRRRVIPRFPGAGAKARTLDEEELVPSALIKFKPIETDSVVFTGLRNELLEIIEPLVHS